MTSMDKEAVFAFLGHLLYIGHWPKIPCYLFFLKIFIYLFLAVLVFVAALRLPLIGASRSDSLAVVCGLLVALTSLLQSVGSRECGLQ